MTDSIQALVRADLEKREELGIERYGTSLRPHNGRDALRDAYEEALDLACYLKQARVERAEPPVEKVLDVAELIADDRDAWKARCEAAETAMACLRENANNAVEALGRAESEAASLRAESDRRLSRIGDLVAELTTLRMQLAAATVLLDQALHEPLFKGPLLAVFADWLRANAPAAPTRTDEEAKK